MRYRPLGRTGLYVSELCLGTMTFGGAGFWTAIGQLDQAAADALVARALDAGVNMIDTADCYSDGLAEQIAGRAMKNSGRPRSSVVLATKAYLPTGPGPNDRGNSRGHLMQAVRDSLRRLDTDYIDLYQLHGWDPATPLDETLRALDDMVRAGLLRYVGVSNWPAWAIAQAQGLVQEHGWSRLASVQAYYSLAGRGIERELVPYMQANPLGLMVRSPLAGGFLSGKFDRAGDGPADARRAQFDFPPIDRPRAFDIVDVLREIGAARGVSAARVALAWVLAKAFVTTVIVGAKSVAQLDDNLAATGLALTDDEIGRLDAASALAPEYPGWMIAYMVQEQLQR